MREREREGFAGYGYETSGGDRVTALRDMFDGGGAGRSGDEFEGGGILSLIANLLASPYGSERERTAGVIDQPTRPRARPTPASAPAQTAAEEMMMGSDPARDIRRLPSEMMMGSDPDRDIQRLQAERAYQQAVGIIRDPAAPQEMKQQAMRVIQSMQNTAAPAEVAAPDFGFGPNTLRSTAAEPDFTTRRQALEATMRSPDYPNMSRAAQRLLGEEDRVGIDPRTGRVSSFGASIPR